MQCGCGVTPTETHELKYKFLIQSFFKYNTRECCVREAFFLVLCVQHVDRLCDHGWIYSEGRYCFAGRGGLLCISRVAHCVQRSLKKKHNLDGVCSQRQHGV